jgi:sugar O-acyltransferase (sialic acid O-acetyltransferase NeuD family)
MEKKRKLVIVGDGKFAEIAYEYFTHDSDCEIVGFTVESAFLKQQQFLGLPVVPFETLEEHFKKEDVFLHVAVTFTQLNRVRKRLYLSAKGRGWRFANYVSSRAFVWRNAELGENVFIFEHNTVQPFTKIGNNVVLWSGNHIGHHSTVKDHCFVSSHVVVAGFCEIGEACFLGINSTIANNVTVGPDNWIGLGVAIAKNTEAGLLFKGPRFEAEAVSAPRFFKVKE